MLFQKILNVRIQQGLTNESIHSVNSPSNGKSPAEFEKGEVVLIVHENPVLQPFNKLAKPVWPKTPATIPSTFFRDINHKVCIYYWF